MITPVDYGFVAFRKYRLVTATGCCFPIGRSVFRRWQQRRRLDAGTHGRAVTLEIRVGLNAAGNGGQRRRLSNGYRVTRRRWLHGGVLRVPTLATTPVRTRLKTPVSLAVAYTRPLAPQDEQNGWWSRHIEHHIRVWYVARENKSLKII